jgi:hypothetical protein
MTSAGSPGAVAWATRHLAIEAGKGRENQAEEKKKKEGKKRNKNAHLFRLHSTGTGQQGGRPGPRPSETYRRSQRLPLTKTC